MTAIKCELCRRETTTGARLCVSCAEAVKRISEASKAVTPTNEVGESEAESLKRKAERAQAQAERLTPVVLG